MPRLSYHTTILEAALADMQRATNSKRSIAEIALTRMCSARLMATPEALAARIEELEKQITLLKMGVPTQPIAQTEQKPTEKKAEPTAPKAVEVREEKRAPEASSAPTPYGNFGEVLERISEIKKSLSSQFVSGKAYRASRTDFIIQLNKFFADRLNSSEADKAIVRGVIAELEGLAPSEVNVRFEEKGAEKGNGALSDLDNI